MHTHTRTHICKHIHTPTLMKNHIGKKLQRDTEEEIEKCRETEKYKPAATLYFPVELYLAVR